MKYDEVSAKAGSGKKKGAAESKELSEDGPAIDQADKGSAKKGHHKKGGAKHHGNMPKKKGAAEYGGKKGDDSKSKKDYEGAAKYKKGAGDYDVKKGSHDHPHSGPGRMGYTQNFGPARQNSYAKGAAKVAKIMGYPGAGDHIDGHPAEEIKLNDVTPSGGVKTSNAKDDLRNIIKSQSEYDANTTSVSRELAEKDSLRLVAQNKGDSAKSLYGYQYDSSMPLDGAHIGDGSNSGWSGGLTWGQKMNIEKLTKKARKIQGTRPTLD